VFRICHPGSAVAEFRRRQRNQEARWLGEKARVALLRRETAPADPLLPERETEAKGYEICEWTVEVIDVALVPEIKTQGEVFGHPQIYATPCIEPTLRRGAIAEVKAVASDHKWFEASVAEKVIGRVEGAYSQALAAESPIRAGPCKLGAHA
jgi:hypothetical protein